MQSHGAGAAELSGPLQRVPPPACTVEPGAALLLPATPPAPAAPGAKPTPPVTTGAAIVLTMEGPNPPPAGVRLPAPPPRFVGVESSAPPRPTVVALNKDVYAALSALAEGAAISVEAEVKAGARTQTWNAVGRLPGSDAATAKEVILLSAHLDHLGARTPQNAAAGADTIYNGADDDASGTHGGAGAGARRLRRGRGRSGRSCSRWFGSEEAGGTGVALLRRHARRAARARLWRTCSSK